MLMLSKRVKVVIVLLIILVASVIFVSYKSKSTYKKQTNTPTANEAELKANNDISKNKPAFTQ